MRLFEGTEFDRPPTCDRCGRLEAECECPPPEHVWLAPERQSAKIRVEKRKRGKTVTVVAGLDATESNLPDLLTRLKNECGAGGTVSELGVEIQGQHVDRIAKKLTQIGYRILK